MCVSCHLCVIVTDRYTATAARCELQQVKQVLVNCNFVVVVCAPNVY